MLRSVPSDASGTVTRDLHRNSRTEQNTLARTTLTTMLTGAHNYIFRSSLSLLTPPESKVQSPSPRRQRSMTEGDKAFFTRRIREESRKADMPENQELKQFHLRWARLYQERLDGLPKSATRALEAILQEAGVGPHQSQGRKAIRISRLSARQFCRRSQDE
jgi:hypothetical protein